MIAHARLWPLGGLLLVAACSTRPEAKKKAEAAPEPMPDVFEVRFETSKGPFVIEVHKDWAPIAADRFYQLSRLGYYNDARFFRVLRNYIAQWGINGDPAVNRQWASSILPDDKPRESNLQGTVTFAHSGPMTRTTQVFVNLADNQWLDKEGFVPFGRVTSGMEVFDRFYSGYGDQPQRGKGPPQDLIQSQGNEFLVRSFPRLDYIKRATLVK